MSDATPEDLDRMALSRRVLHGFERMGMQGRIEDNARMIWEEIAVLTALIAKYPAKAETLGTVIERYRALLRSIAN